MSAELLNCPFCGSSASLIQSTSNGWARCSNKGCFMSDGGARPDIWNTRTPELSFLDKPEAFERIREAIWAVSWDRTESIPFKFPTGETVMVNSQKFEIEEVVNAAIAAIKRMAKEGV